MAGKLSAYGFEMLASQAAQMTLYKATAVDGQPGSYWVQRIEPDAGSAPTATAASASSATSAASAASPNNGGASTRSKTRGVTRFESTPSDIVEVEHGLDRDTARRLVSAAGCTCQMRTSHGIICRHELVRCWKTEMTSLPDDAIDPFWFARDADDERPAAAKETRSSVPALAQTLTTMTPAERDSAMMDMCRAVSTLASSRADWSRAWTRVIQSQLDVMRGDDVETAGVAMAIDAQGAIPIPNPTVSASRRQKRLQPPPGVPGSKSHAAAAKKHKAAANGKGKN